MKLLSLNTWGCRVNSVFDFIQKHVETDIICLQEVMEGGSVETERHEKTDSFETIEKLLPHHKGYFSKYIDGSHYGEEPKNFSFGIATFINSSLGHSLSQSIELLDRTKKWNDYSGRFAGGVAQVVSVEDLTIINVHGLWQDLVIEDTEAKLEESNMLVKLSNEATGRKILCGDFNLTQNTRPIKILNSAFTNVVDKYNISDTRGPLYKGVNRFADYLFVDSKIRVKSFDVPNVSISDHLPLILEFN
jgi:endonuclease/exonuclease/phosphatase family metal-dependent hydrolase